MAKLEGANETIVEIAALLHDVGKYQGREGHDERSFELARDFLKNFDLPQQERELILKCIRKHSGKYSFEDNEVEVKVVQSADVLGTFFDEEWQKHCRETMNREILLSLFEKRYGMINLQSAREIVLPQVNKLKKQLNGN